eukprot:Skav216174  [mRNA]  locus=scaffold2249:58985:67689:+ [translate_table: standard]
MIDHLQASCWWIIHPPATAAQVDGVFAGWTASNVVATAEQVADLSWEIWQQHSIAPKEFVDQMIPQVMRIYGLGKGYGHLGATYGTWAAVPELGGYQSIVGFFPELNVSVAIATNIETDKQAGPAARGIFADRLLRDLLTDEELAKIPEDA